MQPYVIRVDRSSGETQIITALKSSQPRTYEHAVNCYFISQYVRLREGWLNNAARENAYTVMLMSEQGEAQHYIAGVQSSNRNAASNIYGDKGFVSISIRTISFLRPTVAQVRYTKVLPTLLEIGHCPTLTVARWRSFRIHRSSATASFTSTLAAAERGRPAKWT